VYKKLVRCLVFILAAFLLGACGLLVGEPFIPPIPQWAIHQDASHTARIDISFYELNPAFTNFVIFYRIYVSGVDILSTTMTDTVVFNQINPALHSDFFFINPRIDNEDLIGENMHNVFTARHFRYLALEGADITQILGRDFFYYRPALDRILEFDFAAGGIPVMRVGAGGNLAVFNLLRANSHQGIGSFNPLPPDRLFFNSLELRDRENINPQINADVADRTGILDIDRRYTYAAMFIVAVGRSDITFANVYSTPAMIHVFRLPEEVP